MEQALNSEPDDEVDDDETHLMTMHIVDNEIAEVDDIIIDHKLQVDEVDEPEVLDVMLLLAKHLVDEIENVVVYREVVFGMLDDEIEKTVAVIDIEMVDVDGDDADDDEVRHECKRNENHEYSLRDTQQPADIILLDEQNILAEVIPFIALLQIEL